MKEQPWFLLLFLSRIWVWTWTLKGRRRREGIEFKEGKWEIEKKWEILREWACVLWGRDRGECVVSTGPAAELRAVRGGDLLLPVSVTSRAVCSAVGAVTWPRPLPAAGNVSSQQRTATFHLYFGCPMPTYILLLHFFLHSFVLFLPTKLPLLQLNSWTLGRDERPRN